jgi:hypothetical protein
MSFRSSPSITATPTIKQCDVMLPINMWTILDRHQEDVEGKYKDFDVFPTADCPFRYFRMYVKVQKGTSPLGFRHIDVIGIFVFLVSDSEQLHSFVNIEKHGKHVSDTVVGLCREKHRNGAHAITSKVHKPFNFGKN